MQIVQVAPNLLHRLALLPASRLQISLVKSTYEEYARKHEVIAVVQQSTNIL